MAELTILDVGHGNCAVLHHEQWTFVIDTGPRDTLLELLEQRGIREIDVVLISHADADHIAGLYGLLAQERIVVRAVHLNADPLRGSDLWHALRVALADARKRGQLDIQPHLTTSTPPVVAGPIQLRVLAPSPEMALGGVGGQDLQGHPLTANSMSAVVQLLAYGRPEALLTGDLDGIGLDNLLIEHPDPRARVLVFPHHGGRPGRADPYAFALRLCRAVQPEMVVFSHARGKHGTPLPEIVRGVVYGVPAVHVACTQLSERCATALPREQPQHLAARPARGRPALACCAGTVELTLDADGLTYSPNLAEHLVFIKREAPSALCQVPRPQVQDY